MQTYSARRLLRTLMQSSALLIEQQSVRREAIIPARAAGSGHMQFYAQSCRLSFKRDTGKFKPVQKGMKKIGHRYLDSIEISSTVLVRLAISER